ncbi:MAG: hypothetical protein WKF90_04630 [Pyrinomonadaceae bacterium]
MKTYITLCFIAILLFVTSAFAQSAKKIQRSTPQSKISSSTDFDKFIGAWEYAPEYSTSKEKCFKITKEQPKKFKFVEGFKYQGKITWTDPMLSRGDAIYLKPLNGKLVGQFSSANFRATHGYELIYQITLSLEDNGEIIYSISGDLSERNHANRLNNGEDTDEVSTSSNKATTKSDASKKTLAEKSWQSFWTKFSNAIYKRDTKTLVQLSSADDEFFDGGGGGTSKDWFKMMSSEWNLVKKAVMSGVGRIEIFEGGEQYEGQISRTTNKHIPMIFHFEKDNKWRFYGVMGD